MATLLELACDIVSSNVSTTSMSSDELLQEIQKVYSGLQALEASKTLAAAEKANPAIIVKESFNLVKANEKMADELSFFSKLRLIPND
jgi:predicted transcriptional regulator